MVLQAYEIKWKKLMHNQTTKTTQGTCLYRKLSYFVDV